VKRSQQHVSSLGDKTGDELYCRHSSPLPGRPVCLLLLRVL
jgi:hypothetical protein